MLLGSPVVHIMTNFERDLLATLHMCYMVCGLSVVVERGDWAGGSLRIETSHTLSARLRTTVIMSVLVTLPPGSHCQCSTCVFSSYPVLTGPVIGLGHICYWAAGPLSVCERLERREQAISSDRLYLIQTFTQV